MTLNFDGAIVVRFTDLSTRGVYAYHLPTGVRQLHSQCNTSHSLLGPFSTFHFILPPSSSPFLCLLWAIHLSFLIRQYGWFAELTDRLW
jgi:hypothetical protein